MLTAVIGAGPAGMLAALSAHSAGATVVLLDEQRQIGGHLRYDPYGPTADVPTDIWLGELAQAIEASAIAVRLETVVWAAYRTSAGFDLMLASNGNPETLPVDRVILATGTTDVELNAPGATAPGVMTERAARILIETYGVIPGGRFVIVSDDEPRASRLAQLLGREGNSVTTVVPDRIIEIGPSEGVAFVRTRDRGRVDADVVVVAIGERPDLQLAGMLDLPGQFDAARNGWYAGGGELPDGIAIAGGALLGASSPAELIFSAIGAESQITNAGRELPITESFRQTARSPR